MIFVYKKGIIRSVLWAITSLQKQQTQAISKINLQIAILVKYRTSIQKPLIQEIKNYFVFNINILRFSIIL